MQIDEAQNTEELIAVQIDFSGQALKSEESKLARRMRRFECACGMKCTRGSSIFSSSR